MQLRKHPVGRTGFGIVVEHNCTRQIAEKDPMEIVTVKGFCSGAGILLIGLSVGEKLPMLGSIAVLLVLGCLAYGLSIFFHTYAQRNIGAAKASTYYALAPFISALLSVIVLGEPITAILLSASLLMGIDCYLAGR